MVSQLTCFRVIMCNWLMVYCAIGSPSGIIPVSFEYPEGFLCRSKVVVVVVVVAAAAAAVVNNVY